MDIIKRWIDESDVYMLILGGRYGSVEKTSNLSYTELEYDYAVEQGKALFAVVMKEDALEQKVKVYGSDMIEKENPKELKLFREKVLSKMSSFFADEKDIKLSVHESLADFNQNRDLKGWVSAGEIEDTSNLYEELRALRAENSSLKEALDKAQKASTPRVSESASEFEELRELLNGIEVKIPDDAAGGEGFTSDLLSIFISMRDSLTTGITNQAGSDAGSNFLYHNIAPKLAVHGLMENEKIAGVRYRRSFVSKKGLEFLAYYDRKKAQFKKSGQTVVQTGPDTDPK